MVPHCWGSPQGLVQSIFPLLSPDTHKCNQKLIPMPGIHYLQDFPQAVLSAWNTVSSCDALFLRSNQILCILLMTLVTNTNECVFSYIRQFSDTISLSDNSTQFQHYPPGGRVRSHRLRALSHITALFSLQIPFRSPDCHLCF